ncbi:MAG: hypothetical protein K2Q22_09940 [Cytophagales bacterium]|nr:hypothetical protein [Cytophagales bacterium]
MSADFERKSLTFKWAFLLSLLLFGSNSGIAQPRDTCQVGLFVTSLHDFNLTDQSYTTEFWLWFNYRNDSLHPLETREISNSKSVESTISDTEKKGGINWATEKIRANIKTQWQLAHFPFDRQKLTIEIEEAIFNTSQMVYVPDVENSTYDQKNMDLVEWKVVGFTIFPATKTYNTTYGDPELKGESSYPSVRAEIIIERIGTGLFFKLFTGVYVAFFIAMMVFFIEPIDVDPRFGLSVGGLFAAVGNKYIVDSNMPESTSFTLIDKVHAMTFFFILISIVISAISLYLFKNNQIGRSKKLDRVSFFVLAFTYVTLNSVLIYMALNPSV